MNPQVGGQMAALVTIIKKSRGVGVPIACVRSACALARQSASVAMGPEALASGWWLDQA